jgi:thioesterase domain-containing protein
LRENEVQEYLYRHIPLSEAMGVRVVEAGPERVVLEAPLAPNVNHRDTAFGGSVVTLAILTAWAHVHFRLRARGFRGHTVIQRSSIEYTAPASTAFRAICDGAGEEEWARLCRAVDRHGKGRIHMAARVETEGREVARFEGDYVALRA